MPDVKKEVQIGKMYLYEGRGTIFAIPLVVEKDEIQRPLKHNGFVKVILLQNGKEVMYTVDWFLREYKLYDLSS